VQQQQRRIPQLQRRAMSRDRIINELRHRHVLWIVGVRQDRDLAVEQHGRHASNPTHGSLIDVGVAGKAGGAHVFDGIGVGEDAAAMSGQQVPVVIVVSRDGDGRVAGGDRSGGRGRGWKQRSQRGGIARCGGPSSTSEVIEFGVIGGRGQFRGGATRIALLSLSGAARMEGRASTHHVTKQIILGLFSRWDLQVGRGWGDQRVRWLGVRHGQRANDSETRGKELEHEDKGQENK